MSTRVLRDAAGVQWEVWEVHPSLVEKRDTSADPSPTGQERRRATSMRIPVSPTMRGGWLAMRSESERRRIAPVPEGWMDMDDRALLRLVETAATSGLPRRLVE